MHRRLTSLTNHVKLRRARAHTHTHARAHTIICNWGQHGGIVSSVTDVSHWNVLCANRFCSPRTSAEESSGLWTEAGTASIYFTGEFIASSPIIPSAFPPEEEESCSGGRVMNDNGAYLICRRWRPNLSFGWSLCHQGPSRLTQEHFLHDHPWSTLH